MSQRAPGYRFQYHVPPTSPPASMTTAVKPRPAQPVEQVHPCEPGPDDHDVHVDLTAIAGGRRRVGSLLVDHFVDWTRAVRLHPVPLARRAHPAPPSDRSGTPEGFASMIAEPGAGHPAGSTPSSRSRSTSGSA